MGINNSKKKTNMLKKEGFYVVLFLCLCVVAVVTVYISKTNALKKETELAKNQQVKVEEKIQDAQQVKDTKENTTVPTMKNNTKESSKVKNTKEDTEKAKEETEKTKEETEKSKDTSSKKATISLTNPIKGDVTKKFSKEELQYTSSLDIWETHEALDIACSLGAEVKSAAKGTVVDIYNDDKAEKTLKSGYGVTVVIEHDNQYRTVYSNLGENLKVKKGDKVELGAVIGVVGDTSIREAVKDDGAHLHFGVLQKKGNDYVTVDPTAFMKK